MAKYKIKVISNFPKVKGVYGVKALNMANAMANDLMSGSYASTPKKSGDLRKNRKKAPYDSGVLVAWMSSYAAVQEAGKRRGARAFSRYTTAGTGAHFVANKVKDIKANYKRYWK